MPGDRLLRILARLRTERDGEPRDVAPLCEVCVHVLQMSGAGIMLMSGDSPHGSVCSSNAVSALLEELQFTLGEGPCVDAYGEDRPVLEPNLPMRLRGAVIGAISLFRMAEGQQSEVDVVARRPRHGPGVRGVAHLRPRRQPATGRRRTRHRCRYLADPTTSSPALSLRVGPATSSPVQRSTADTAPRVTWARSVSGRRKDLVAHAARRWPSSARSTSTTWSMEDATPSTTQAC